MILVVGSEGAQGKRYRSILKYLKVEHWGLDLELSPQLPAWPPLTGIILATPTDTHIGLVREFLRYRLPILVEKPFSKDVDALKGLAPDIEASASTVSMVMQYEHLAKQRGTGPSHYNYFRHGNDGLIWDCLQIIALANGPVTLKEDSPIWSCAINGRELNIGDMDAAYVAEIQGWLEGHTRPFSEIIAIHEKVKAYADSH